MNIHRKGIVAENPLRWRLKKWRDSLTTFLRGDNSNAASHEVHLNKFSSGDFIQVMSRRITRPGLKTTTRFDGTGTS